MPATIEICGKQATVRHGVWSSDDADLLEAVRDESHYIELGPGDGDPDIALAEEVAARYGGKLVWWKEPTGPPGRVY